MAFRCPEKGNETTSIKPSKQLITRHTISELQILEIQINGFRKTLFCNQPVSLAKLRYWR